MVQKPRTLAKCAIAGILIAALAVLFVSAFGVENPECHGKFGGECCPGHPDKEIDDIEFDGY